MRFSNEIVFGDGAVSVVAPWLVARGARHVLLVADRGLSGIGTAAAVADQLVRGGLHVDVFDGVEPNPTVDQVTAAVAAYRRADADAVVALGGGSALDCGKATALLIANGGSLDDYEGHNESLLPLPPLVCIPTTCGTGAEVTFSCLVARDDGVKIPIIGRELQPPLAVLDPSLLVTLPIAAAVASAVDAICHAVESFTNVMASPLTDALDRAALSLLVENLEAGTQGRAIAARERLLVGANLAGIAISVNAANLCHAMCYPLTARYGIPHGVAVGILLPTVLRFNEGSLPEREAELATLLGATQGESAPERAASLFASVGVPTDLADTGARRDHVPELVPGVMTSRNVALNPQPVSDHDVASLYHSLIPA